MSAEDPTPNGDNDDVEKIDGLSVENAISRGDLNRLKQIFDGGNVDVDMRFSNGKTALLISAEHGSMDCLHFLLDKEASVHLCNESGDQPLDVCWPGTATLNVRNC